VLIWLPMQRIPPPLASMLCVPGLLYESLIRARNGLYDAGVLPQRYLPGPVLSVGNITMGGTGKTPLVLYIAQVLTQRGFRPAILTRGYRRTQSNKTRILAPNEGVPSAAKILGDEPAVMRRHLSSAWMGISKNRFRAGCIISQRLRQAIFILDDGFQHRRLYRDLDIVILDRSQALQSNRVFPRGTLREPLSGLHRCHAIVLNGTRDEDAGDPFIEEIARCHPQASIFCCSQTIGSLVHLAAWDAMDFSVEVPRPHSAYLVAALGNPQRFEQDVQRLGIDVRGAKFFPDHYWPAPEDWRACAEDARSKHAETIITTEKDAVKILQSQDFPVMVSIQSTCLSNAHAFEAMLLRYVEGWLDGRQIIGMENAEKSG
jgi:tetraacyldisaccharide 4'-kinase